MSRSRSAAKKTVVIVATPGILLLDIAGPADVFSIASKEIASQEKGYEIILASVTKNKHIATKSGIRIACDICVTDINFPIDTLLIAGVSLGSLDKIPASFFTWLTAHYPGIRRMGSVCVGAFVLAKAGLLHNKRATTHWEHCTRLQAAYPSVIVDSTPFFVRDGNIYTSGGVTSSMDLSLALVEEDFGREVALQVSRQLVLHLRRAGNQSQFSNLLPSFELKSPLIRSIREWLLKNLDREIRVEYMADHVNMSPRNFARVFLKETQLTPAKFVEKLRVEVARQYLEDTNLSAEQIAEKCGLGNLVSMRRVFIRHLQISPSFYRHAFRTTLATEMAS